MNKVILKTDKKQKTKKKIAKKKPKPAKKKKKFLNYYKYIKSPKWFRKRLKALNFHGHYCRVCGTNQNLHVHHLTYKNIGNERMADLMILCAKHHREIHEKERINGLK